MPADILIKILSYLRVDNIKNPSSATEAAANNPTPSTTPQIATGQGATPGKSPKYCWSRWLLHR